VSELTPPFRIEFVVPGMPVAQPRIKATFRGGHAAVYTPTKTSSKKSNGIAEFKALIKLTASQAYSGALLSGPLKVDVVCVFRRQASKIWSKKPMPRYRHVTKPDRDNLDKAILDSLKGIIWYDDNQVCAGSIEKWHASGDEQPHVVIRIEELEAQ